MRRSPEDRLAFAVHCYLLADGYKPVAVGKQADEADLGASPASPPLSAFLLPRQYQARSTDAMPAAQERT